MPALWTAALLRRAVVQRLAQAGRGWGEVSGDRLAPEGVIPAEQCLAWIERYAAVPFNGLAMQSALDKTHSPLAVMASLAWHVRAALARLDSEATP